MVGNKSRNCCRWFIDFIGSRRYRKNIIKTEKIEFEGFGMTNLFIKDCVYAIFIAHRNVATNSFKKPYSDNFGAILPDSICRESRYLFRFFLTIFLSMDLIFRSNFLMSSSAGSSSGFIPLLPKRSRTSLLF